MKRSLEVILCLIAFLGLHACSKREPAENPFTRITGTWKLTATATDENRNKQLDGVEILSLSPGITELLKFNIDSSGNEHKPINNITQDFAFTWHFQNTFHDVIRVFTANDTIISHIDLLTSNSLYLRNSDSVYFDTSVIYTWKIYQKK